MNRFLIQFIIFIAFGMSTLFASQKETNNIAQISAASLYNIDKVSLQSTIRAYIKNNPNIKALRIVETLSQETYISIYRDNDNIIYSKKLPQTLSQYKSFKAQSKYEEENVGEVTAYFASSLNELNKQEIAWIKTHPVIKIAVVKNYPPYDMHDNNGKLIGFHSDIVTLMNDKLSTNIVLIPYNSWSEAYRDVTEGKIGSIFSLSWSKEREENHFIYSPNYYFTPYHLLVKKQNQEILSLESLKNKNIAIEENTIFSKVVEQRVPSAKIVYTKSNEATYESVQNGQAKATISSNLEKKILRKYDLKVVSEIYHKSSELYIGTNKKYPVVASILKKGLDSISLREMTQIRKKWFEVKKQSRLNLTRQEEKWLNNNNIVLSVDDQYAPMNFKNDKNILDGFSIDYIKAIETIINKPILLQGSSWPDALNNAMSHKTDGIINANSTLKRSQKLLFTRPYVTVPMGLMSSINKENINGLSALSGKTILVKEKTAESEFLPKKYKNIKFREVKEYKQALKEVSLGQAYGVFGHLLVLENEAEKVMLPNLKTNYVDFMDVVTNQSIGVRNNAPELKSILDKAIAAISKKQRQQINIKWMSESVNSIQTRKIAYTKEEQAWIRNNPFIKIGLMNYWVSDDNGNNVHTDFLKLFNKYSNLHFLPIRYDAWKDGFNDATQGKLLHGILNLSWSKDREENNFYYTKPYHFTPSQLIVRNDNYSIKSIKDLKNKTVYLRDKSITHKTIQEQVPSAQIINLKNESNMYNKLASSKEADAILDYSLSKKRVKDNNLKIVQNIYDKYSEVALGISKNQPLLYSIIKKAYANIPKNELLDLQNRVYKKTKLISTVNINTTQREWIQRNPTVKVIQFFDEPPFTINSMPKSGYMYEMIEYLTQSVGLKIDYVKGHSSYGSMLESIENEKADILTTYPTTLNLGTDSHIVASKSVLKTPFVMIGKSNKGKISSMEHFFGKKVAVVQGYAQDKYLDAFPKITKVYVKNNSEGFEAIRSKKANYYINNRANSEYVLNTSFTTDLRILYELPYENFPPLSISFAMNSKNSTLVSILQHALEKMPYQKIKAIQDKWIIQNQAEDIKKLKLTQEERKWIAAHPKIRVHNEKAWAPYNFYEKGRARGLSIDFIKALTKKAGIEIEFISGPTWNEFINMAKNREIDVMLNIVKSPSREKFLNFTESYSELIQSLYIKDDENPITRTQELFGKTFVVPKGFYYEEQLKKFPEIKLLKVNNTLECLQAISFGKADAMLDLTTVVNYYKNKHNIDDVVLGGTLGWEGGSLPINIGVRKDWPELVSILNKAMKSLTDDELDQIENKWLFNNQKNKSNLIPLTNEEKRWIKKNRVKVGVEEWAPIVFSHGGKDIDGITGDVLKLIVERTGLKLEVVNNLWDPLLQSFKNKELDLLPATYFTEERAKYGLYSQGYHKMLDYLYIKDTNTSIKSMLDLKGKRLAVPKGFGTIPKIKEKFPSIIIVETEDLSDSIQRVLTGDVDALFDGQISVEYKMQENLIRGLKGLPQKDFEAASLHFFSHNDKPILRDILTKALQSISSYEINKIKSKWLLQNSTKENLFDMEQDKKKLTLVDILPIKEIAVGIIVFLFVFYLIWKFQVKASNKDMTLKSTLFVIIGLFLFFASVITLLTLENIEKSQKVEIEESLKAVVNSSYKTIKLWANAEFRRMKIVLSNNKLAQLIEEIENNSNALEKVQTHFKTFEKVFDESKYYLVSNDLNMILSSDKDYTLTNSDTLAIKKLQDKPSLNRLIVFPSKSKGIHQENILFIKTIKSKTHKNIAYLVMMVDPRKEFTSILQNGRIGKTGETYTFNKNLQMISNSRFDDQLKHMGLLGRNQNSLLNVEIRTMDKNPTYIGQKAFEQNSGLNTKGYKDYRDVIVYGAWIWDKNLNIGFVTEVDEKEAMGAFDNMKKTIVIIVFSIIMFTVFLTVLTAWISTQSKKTLQKSNEELNKLLNSFDDNVIASKTDLQGIITYASKAFCTISGFTHDELIGKSQNIVRHPDTPKETFKKLWKTIQKGQVWRGEIKNRKKDGGFYWVEVVITPEFNSKNEPMGYSAIRQDITSKKEVEDLSKNLEIKVEERTEELQEAQEQFSSMAGNVPGVIYRCKIDENWTMLYISSEIEKLSGYGVSDFINNRVRTFADIMHKEDIEPVAKLIQTQIDKGEKFLVDYRIIDKQGNIKWVRSQGQATVLENSERWLDGVLFDVTEQRALEVQIKENQEQMTFVSQYANFGFWNFNPQIGDLYVNDIFVQMLGYDANEVLMSGYENEMFKPFKDGLAFWEQLLHPDDVQRTREMITAHINGETDLYKIEYRMRKADGSWMWSMAIGRIAQYDNEGKAIRFNGVNIDIQESKDAQERIAQNKLFVDTLLDSQEQIVITTDGQMLRSCNKAFLEFFSLVNIEEFTKDYDCICDKFEENETDSYLQKYMGDLTWIEYILKHDNQTHKAVIKKDGIQKIFTVTAAVMPIDEGDIKSAVFTDITEVEIQKKQTESILSSMLLPILITQKQTRQIVYANPYAQKQYETSIDTLLGMDIEDLYTYEEQRDDILMEMATQGVIQNFETKFKTLQGNEFDAILSLIDITYAGQECYLGVASDITQQKNAEQKIREVNKKVSDSIDYASLIQHALIPENSEIRTYFDDYFTIWQPKDVVGGDIYLFEEIRNSSECLLMVIDCTGHGVPGAFVTMLVKAMERQVIADIMNSNQEVSPAKILKYFNSTMKKLLKQESDASISNAGFDGGIFYYNKEKNYIKYAGAETPLFYVQNNELNVIKSNRHSIGYKKSDPNYEFDDHRIDIEVDTKFYISTDGYFDQNGGTKGFPFGKKRFKEFIQTHSSTSFDYQKELLLQTMQEYQGDEERNDDTTVIGFSISKTENRENKKENTWEI